MKKTFCILLILLVTLAAAPVSRAATVVGSGTCGAAGDGSNLTWTLDSDGLLTVNGRGGMKSYDWYNDSPWHQNTAIHTILIQNGVTSIGDYAFSDCTGLTSVTIPDSVTSIGRYAFSKCTGLPSVTIENSGIGEAAFSGCTALTSVTIGSGVTHIENYAFEDCTGLTSVMIPLMTGIGLGAFPASTVIHGYAGSYAQRWAETYNCAFEEINNATVILNTPKVVNVPTVTAHGYANPGAEVVCSVNGKESAKVRASANFRWSAELPLTGTKDGDSFTINAAVTQDGKTAEKTATVTYEPDATSADTEVVIACGNCGAESDESNVTWTLDGNGLLTISGSGEMTGYGKLSPPWSSNTAFQSAVIQNGVTSIGMNAITGRWLTSVTIPESVTSIGWCAISGPWLINLNVDANNPVYFSAGNCIIERESKTLVVGCNNSVIPNDGSVTSIGGFAFLGCEGLASVAIPDGVTSIGSYAFDGCAELTTVTIPDSMTSIGHDAFTGCTGLTSVTIPASVTEIGSNAIPASTVIYGYAGSYAQQWAKENERTFVVIEDAPGPDPAYAPGDVDGDGELSSGDARLALRASVGLEATIKPGSNAYLAADADGDGEVTSGDARLILRASVGLEDPEAWGK